MIFYLLKRYFQLFCLFNFRLFYPWTHNNLLEYFCPPVVGNGVNLCMLQPLSHFPNHKGFYNLQSYLVQHQLRPLDFLECQMYLRICNLILTYQKDLLSSLFTLFRHVFPFVLWSDLRSPYHAKSLVAFYHTNLNNQYLVDFFQTL